MRLIDQTKLVTAVSELARNTVVYGGGGDMDWQLIEDGTRVGVRLTFRDEGRHRRHQAGHDRRLDIR